MYAILAALALMLVALFGCSSLPAVQQARADAFECRAAALAPLVEPMHDAGELLRKLEDGSADLRHVLATLNATQKEFEALVERLQACDPPAPFGSPVPEPEPAPAGVRS